MKVTIVGAGNAGYAHACKLVERGHSVKMLKTSHSLHEASFNKVVEQQGIYAIDGTEGDNTFFAKLDLVTRDIKAALSEVDVVYIMTQSTQHETLAQLITPYLSSNQMVIIVPGNMGSIYFNRHADKKDIIFAEGESTPYDARIIENGVVRILFKNVRNALGFLPAGNYRKGMEIAQQLFDTYHGHRKNIIDSALHNPNLIVHTVGVLMSASRIEYSSGEFYLYREGFTPSIWNLVEALDNEKLNVLEFFGCDRLKYLDACKWRNEEDLTKDSLEVFKSYGNSGPKGPLTLNTRYIYEDVTMVLCLMSSIAKHFSIPTPICNSLINIACALLKRNFWTEGRTLEKLGLGNMNKQEIIDFITK